MLYLADMSKNLSELSGRKGIEDNLFTRLGELAQQTGTPGVDELDKLADEFLVGKATTYGTTTFYDFLKPGNRGKKAYVCNGTACTCAGTQDRVIQELKTYYADDEIGHMTCLGRCHENNAFSIDGKNHSGTAITELDSIIKSKTNRNQDRYIVKASGDEILIKPFTDVNRYYTPFRSSLETDSALILKEIQSSNLRGRGGAGFPTGLKLEYCRNAGGDTKFIICNADEGDPGAYSDRYLLEQRPHSILFGMLIAGYVTHATHGVIYIRAEYPEAVIVVREAIDEIRKAGLLGNNIDGTGFSFDIKLIQARGSYLCGEETALINSIEGQRPEVRIRPPYPAQQGLFNKPTVVLNVETLAALHPIIEQGGAAWKAMGTNGSAGSKLVSLDSFFNNPGIFEVEMGTALPVIINDLGGGFKKVVKALQIGGPLGGVVPLSKIDKLTVDFESFSSQGFILGHASIISIPEDFPMMRFIEHLFGFAASESCGKCFPCRLGTKRGHELCVKALNSTYKIDRELFNDLLTTLEKGSLCAHGSGIPLPVRNIMDFFSIELEQYFS